MTQAGKDANGVRVLTGLVAETMIFAGACAAIIANLIILAVWIGETP